MIPRILGTLVVLCVTLLAQAVTESYSQDSPEVTGLPGSTAGDMVTVNTARPGTAGLTWSHAAIGVPPGGNVDAFSDALDVANPFGPLGSGPILCRWQDIEFTVDRASSGVPGSVVMAEAMQDGAASDTFTSRWIFGPVVLAHRLTTDHAQVTPKTETGPLETDLDALTFGQKPHYPVFYSVDAATAATMSATLGFAITAGDVLTVNAPFTPPAIFYSIADLGLLPGDDIDALSVSKSGAGPVLVYSLTRASPTASAVVPGSGTPLRGSGLFTTAAAGTPTAAVRAWASPASLGLANGDELDGVRIADPMMDGGGPQTGPGGAPFRALRADLSGGDDWHRVDFLPTDPIPLSVDAPVPGGPVFFALAIELGRPCNSVSLPTPFGTYVLGSLTPTFLVDGAFTPWSLTLPPLSFLPPASFPLEFTLQGLMLSGPSGAPELTNALSVLVAP